MNTFLELKGAKIVGKCGVMDQFTSYKSSNIHGRSKKKLNGGHNSRKGRLIGIRAPKGLEVLCSYIP